MVFFKRLPKRTNFYHFYSLDFGAGFISLFCMATGLFYACLYFWHPCKSLYTAEGSVQIPIIICLVILSLCGALLFITALMFLIGIATKIPNVVPALVVALLMLPCALFLYNVMALIRILVDKVSCPVKFMGMKVPTEVYYGTEILLSVGTGVVFTDFSTVINSIDIEDEEEEICIEL